MRTSRRCAGATWSGSGSEWRRPDPPRGRPNWSADWPVEPYLRIVITRRGVPVAVLVPVEAKASRDAASVVAELLEFRKGRKLAGDRITDWIREGRRE